MRLVYGQHGGVMIWETVVQLGGPCFSCHDTKHLPADVLVRETEPLLAPVRKIILHCIHVLGNDSDFL